MKFNNKSCRFSPVFLGSGISPVLTHFCAGATLRLRTPQNSDITDEEMETDEDDSDIRSEDFSDAFDED
ncbi:hypothetical protein EVAR_99471_1 [Eumeta japonica]|uniref:Uncharacterized protein n=1 Tax=Eumeta variegata TaxID=151549 RepID=A0A4C1SN83_EUMVA|nr:hypothetical protein EVAR_99471_1 [Eumeta japonica]